MTAAKLDSPVAVLPAWQVMYRAGTCFATTITHLSDCDAHHDLPMMDTLGRRIFLSHLGLSYRLGRKVTLAEFGEMIAKRLGRTAPFTAAAVSRWEAGAQVPSLQIIEAIAELTDNDPGWISHGSRSAAPRPRRLPTPPRSIAIVGEGASTAERKPRPASSARKRATVARRRS